MGYIGHGPACLRIPDADACFYQKRLVNQLMNKTIRPGQHQTDPFISTQTRHICYVTCKAQPCP